jgi:2-polyprenyl-3-methyl-5-hydroxy-6-metoxy-1,4-benzoquinol methylase
MEMSLENRGLPVTIELTNRQMIHFLRTLSSGQKGLRKMMTIYRPLTFPCAEILNMIPVQTSIYDIGCGGGVLLSLLAKYKYPKRLAGHDTNQDMVNTALLFVKQAISSATELNVFHMKEGSNLHLAGYEYITLIDVLHHIPKASQEFFLESIYDSMDKESYLIVKDIDGGSILRFINKLHDLLLARQIVYEVPESIFKRRLEYLGFQIISEQRKIMLGYPHFLIVARK